MEANNKDEFKNRFSCSLCNDKMFSSKGNLTKHYKHLHGATNEEFQCPICDGYFSTFDTLTRHVNTKHKGLRGTCSV